MEEQNEPVAYINVEERKLEWAKPITWHTPTIAQMDKIPLYTHPADESFDRTASHMAGEYVSHRSLAEEITEGFDALKRIRELEAECDRLYRIIELNGTLK